jgi:hypothetical protein
MHHPNDTYRTHDNTQSFDRSFSIDLLLYPIVIVAISEPWGFWKACTLIGAGF